MVLPSLRCADSSTFFFINKVSSWVTIVVTVGNAIQQAVLIACALRIGLLDETDVGAADAEQALQARERGAVRRQAKRRRLEQQAHVAKLPPVNKQRDAADYFAGYAGPESSANAWPSWRKARQKTPAFAVKTVANL